MYLNQLNHPTSIKLKRDYWEIPNHLKKILLIISKSIYDNHIYQADKSEEIYESPGRIMKLNSKIKQRNEEIKLKNQLSEEINKPDDKDVSESDN